jgi:hypothetical protein
MTGVNQSLAAKTAVLVATCIVGSAILFAQEVNPRGVPPPRRNTPDNPDREAESEAARKVRRDDAPRPDRRAILAQIKKDFQQIQVVNEDLSQQLAAGGPLDYKHVSDSASKIRSLADRLDSNLVLGESENKGSRPEYDFSEAALRSSLVTLHDLVISFVENRIFRERGVFDIQETKRAKGDVDEIIALSDQIKKIAKKLRKDAGKQ